LLLCFASQANDVFEFVLAFDSGSSDVFEVMVYTSFRTQERALSKPLSERFSLKCGPALVGTVLRSNLSSNCAKRPSKG